MDSFIWEKVRDLSLGVEELKRESISLLNWQLENAENIADSAMASFNEMNKKYGRKIDEEIEGEGEAKLNDVISGNKSLLDELRAGFSSVLESDSAESGKILGSSAFVSLSYLALEMNSG
jgi:hypothetical protein